MRSLRQFKLLWVLGSHLLACLPVAAYDYSLGIVGPRTGYVGHSIYLRVESAIIEGERDYIYYRTPDLPSGFEVSYPWLEQHCCGPGRGWLPLDTLLRIRIGENTVPGTHVVTLETESAGVEKSVQFPIDVLEEWEPQRAPARSNPRGKKTSPRVKVWEDRMLEIGAYHCNQANIEKQGAWDGSIWQYDGIRVYYQMADYFEDSRWATCAQYVKRPYLDYVIQNEGKVTGWRVYAQGLYEDYLRTGDENSKQGILLMQEHSSYANRGGGVDVELSRETAYLIQAYVTAERLGQPRHRNLERSVGFALGHIDQWFPSNPAEATNSPPVQPFMVGLTMEALIYYYDHTQDTRVPAVVQRAVDGLWPQYWVKKDRAFGYYNANDPESIGRGAPDLSQLIAPAFAWTYRQTGDQKYRQAGDQIFNGGIVRAWLHGGKQFSQSFRWSFDFVRWRTSGLD